MTTIRCVICGNTDLVKQGDAYVCEDCGIEYRLKKGAPRNIVCCEVCGSSKFIKTDGVLVKYNGKGGDVIVPDGVKEIGEKRFARLGYCDYCAGRLVKSMLGRRCPSAEQSYL